MRRLFVLAALCFALPAHATSIDFAAIGFVSGTASCDVEGQVNYFG